MSRKQKVQRTAEEWTRIFKEQEASGLSISEYCELEEIPMSSYSKWKSRLAERDAKPRSFIEIKKDQPKKSITVELSFSNGMVLHIS